MSISTEVDRGKEGGRRGDLKALMYCQSKAGGQSNHTVGVLGGQEVKSTGHLTQKSQVLVHYATGISFSSAIVNCDS